MQPIQLLSQGYALIHQAQQLETDPDLYQVIDSILMLLEKVNEHKQFKQGNLQDSELAQKMQYRQNREQFHQRLNDQLASQLQSIDSQPIHASYKQQAKLQLLKDMNSHINAMQAPQGGALPSMMPGGIPGGGQ